MYPGVKEVTTAQVDEKVAKPRRKKLKARRTCARQAEDEGPADTKSKESPLKTKKKGLKKKKKLKCANRQRLGDQGGHCDARYNA